MQNGFVQVKVVEGVEIRTNEKGEFLLGALITHKGETTGISGIAAGNTPCIHIIHEAVKAIAEVATAALIQQCTPPLLIEATLTDAIEEGVQQAVARHIKEEHPDIYELVERVKKGDSGAVLEMLLSV